MQTRFLGDAHPSAEAQLVFFLHVFAQFLKLKPAMPCAQLVSQRDICLYLLNVLMCLPALLSKPFVMLNFLFLTEEVATEPANSPRSLELTVPAELPVQQGRPVFPQQPPPPPPPPRAERPHRTTQQWWRQPTHGASSSC